MATTTRLIPITRRIRTLTGAMAYRRLMADGTLADFDSYLPDDYHGDVVRTLDDGRLIVRFFLGLACGTLYARMDPAHVANCR